MRFTIKDRRTFTVNMLGILFLALAVFGWGLQYKLSLYDPPGSVTTSTPQAKLLSQKERPAVVRDASLVQHETPQGDSPIYGSVCLSIFAALVLHLGRLLRTRSLPSHEAVQKQRVAAFPFFSFRPPPAFLPAN